MKCEFNVIRLEKMDLSHWEKKEDCVDIGVQFAFDGHHTFDCSNKHSWALYSKCLGKWNEMKKLSGTVSCIIQYNDNLQKYFN